MNFLPSSSVYYTLRWEEKWKIRHTRNWAGRNPTRIWVPNTIAYPSKLLTCLQTNQSLVLSTARRRLPGVIYRQLFCLWNWQGRGAARDGKRFLHGAVLLGYHHSGWLAAFFTPVGVLSPRCWDQSSWALLSNGCYCYASNLPLKKNYTDKQENPQQTGCSLIGMSHLTEHPGLVLKCSSKISQLVDVKP